MRHTILGKNLRPCPLVTFRHKYLTPLEIQCHNLQTLLPYNCSYKFPSILCLFRQKFHLFYRSDLYTLWQDLGPQPTKNFRGGKSHFWQWLWCHRCAVNHDATFLLRSAYQAYQLKERNDDKFRKA